jgi:hypothetical protein
MDKVTRDGLKALATELQSDDYKNELGKVYDVYTKSGYDAALKMYDGQYKELIDQWEAKKK